GGRADRRTRSGRAGAFPQSARRALGRADRDPLDAHRLRRRGGRDEDRADRRWPLDRRLGAGGDDPQRRRQGVGMGGAERALDVGARAASSEWGPAPKRRRSRADRRRPSACARGATPAADARGRVSPRAGSVRGGGSTLRKLRVLYHLMRADYLERVRRHAFLVTLGFTVYFAYVALPPNPAPYSTLDFAGHRGIYNSAWVGCLVALMTSAFL